MYTVFSENACLDCIPGKWFLTSIILERFSDDSAVHQRQMLEVHCEIQMLFWGEMQVLFWGAGRDP